MAKISITTRINSDLVEGVDKLASELATTRSALIELFIRVGLTSNLNETISLFYSSDRKDGRRK